jgi:sugar phosphate isomerase/epimerase
MTNGRLVSLAAGVMPDFSPEDVVYAAAEAGFNATGIWCDLQIWDRQCTHRVRTALQATGLCPLDLEVIWFKPGEPLDTHDAMVDIALELGVHNILCVSSEPETTRTKERFAHLCRKTGNTGLRIVLEFLAITEISSLQQAMDVVQDVAHPAGGILVDALHLYRTGACADDLRAVDAQLMPYIQLCDASAELRDRSFEGLLEDALYLRQMPGEGELPLRKMLDQFDPLLPLSLEIRSRDLMQRTEADPVARAARVFSATQQFLKNTMAQ